jgi:hypothetical protein
MSQQTRAVRDRKIKFWSEFGQSKTNLFYKFARAPLNQGHLGRLQKWMFFLMEVPKLPTIELERMCCKNKIGSLRIRGGE